MGEIKITRCPMCGKADLTARYDEAANKKLGKKTFWFGLAGLVYAVAKNAVSKSKNTYWHCNSCGHDFPIEE